MASTYKGYVGYDDPERARTERARQLAETLQSNALATQPTNLATGLASLGEAFIARRANEKADQAESAYANTVNDRNSRLIAALMPDKPGSVDFDPATQQTIHNPSTPDPQRSIFETFMRQGGSIPDVVALNSALKPEPVKPLVVNDKLVDPNNYSVLFDGTTPKEAPLPSYDNVTLDDGVYAINKSDPTNRIRIGAPPSKAEGAAPSGYRWTKDGLEPIPGGPADKTPGGPMDPDAIKLEREYAKDWKGIQSNYQDIDSQFKRMQTMAARGDSAGDLALVVSFTKMLDPGSVAREGEVALTQSAASFLSQAQNWLPRLEEGNTLLPPDVRRNLLEAAKEMHGVYSGAYQKLAGDYQNTAKSYGFDTGRVMMGYREPEAQAQPPSIVDNLATFGRGVVRGLMPQQSPQGRPMQPARPVAPAAVPAGVDPADWQFMTPEQKALFQ